MPKQLTPTRPSSGSNSRDGRRTEGQRDGMSQEERQAFKRSQAVSAKTTRNVMAQLRKKK